MCAAAPVGMYICLYILGHGMCKPRERIESGWQKGMWLGEK